MPSTETKRNQSGKTLIFWTLKRGAQSVTVIGIRSVLSYRRSNLERCCLHFSECLHFTSSLKDGPVGWGCRILRLHLCREVRLPKECPVFDSKQSYGEATVMLELRGMQNNPSLHRVLSMC